MSQPLPAKSSTPDAAPAAAPAVDPSFEESLHNFWTTNRNSLLLLCAAVIMAVIVREGWDYLVERREEGVREEYARVADRPEKLAAFAEANPDHVLAGVAYLQLADDTFGRADYKGAVAFYQKAATKLKNEALLGRARLGAAMSQVLGGDTAAGEVALKSVSSDTSLAKGARAEATYHLASLAATAGKADDLTKYIGDLGKIDAAGGWSRRAMLLLSNLPAGGQAPTVGTPAIKFTPGG